MTIDWTTKWMCVLALTMPACAVDEIDDEDELAIENDEADEHERELCLYSGNSPYWPDDTDTLVGAAEEVTSEGSSGGGCDLHTFRVNAAAPFDRARHVQFSAVAHEPYDEGSLVVWTRSCSPLCSWTATVPTVLYGEHCTHPQEGHMFCEYYLGGSVSLPANNSIVEVRAGARAFDVEGNAIDVEITVSE